MLKKLYTYHFRSLLKTELACLFSMLGAGILFSICFLLINFLPSEITSVGLGALMALLMLGIVAAYIVGTLFIYIHFYKSSYTDSGYLTFSFPATMQQQLLANILSAASYFALLFVSLILTLAIAVMLPTAFISTDGSVLDYIVYLIKSSFFASIDWGLFVCSLVSGCIDFFSQIILVFTAITLGSIFFKKHKVGGSFLFYFLVWIIVEILALIIGLVVGVLSVSANATTINYIVSIANILLGLITCFGGYYLTLYLLNRKLNLE